MYQSSNTSAAAAGDAITPPYQQASQSCTTPSAAFPYLTMEQQSMLMDQLSALKQQDARYYQCGDYIERSKDNYRRSRRRGVRSRVVSPTTTATCVEDVDLDAELEDEEGDGPSSESAIDAVCREKMIAWGYRVCDHFRTSREICALSFALLDNFIHKCTTSTTSNSATTKGLDQDKANTATATATAIAQEPCQHVDRSTFKLASMTCLYLATKLFNHQQMSVATLALMGGGEYEESHIERMEWIILETCRYRLNPPTVQAFVRLLMPLIGNPAAGVASDLPAIAHYANFLSELAVYDYRLVTESRFHIAIACILNALEGQPDVQDAFFRNIEALDFFQQDGHQDDGRIAFCQRRLWMLYCSASSSSSSPSSSSPPPTTTSTSTSSPTRTAPKPTNSFLRSQAECNNRGGGGGGDDDDNGKSSIRHRHDSPVSVQLRERC